MFRCKRGFPGCTGEGEFQETNIHKNLMFLNGLKFIISPVILRFNPKAHGADCIF